MGVHQRFDRTSSDSIGSASYASNCMVGHNPQNLTRTSNGNELFIEKINRLVSTNMDYNNPMKVNRIEPIIKPIPRYGDELSNVQRDYGMTQICF